MNIYRVTLFGHRDMHAHKIVEQRLCAILRDLVQIKEHIEIYIGRNGEFDTFAASVVKQAQKTFGNENLEMTLILPYVIKDIEFYERYYDSIFIPENVQGTHPKRAIIKRNEWMVEECDLFICYVERNSGGAYTALKYARKLGKKIINLATGIEDKGYL